MKPNLDWNVPKDVTNRKKLARHCKVETKLKLDQRQKIEK
jgi:hypothetical protein